METFGEYDPATPLSQRYCSRISSQEYELQGSTETYAALQNLLEYMDSNSDVFTRILAKKKQEELEGAGIFSFLKCKLWEKVKGPNFMMADITENESSEKRDQLQKEMCEVFNYVQETKSSPVTKRFSKRLAAKRSNRNPSGKTASKRPKGPAPPPPPYPPPGSNRPKEGPEGQRSTPTGSVLSVVPSPRKPLRHDSPLDGNKPKKPVRVVADVAPVCPPAAPPPPPPPLPGTNPKSAMKKPLQERTNTVYITTPTGRMQSPAKKALLKSEPRLKQLQKTGSTTSLNSISSIHDELIGFDKGKLKSVKARSPGRIPTKKAPAKPSRMSKMGDITIDSFNQKILEKFKNAHSPSRYGSPNSLSSSGFGSPSDFTP
nr:serine/arginine repetitive matrix protein 1-like [Lytechinus pictus]